MNDVLNIQHQRICKAFQAVGGENIKSVADLVPPIPKNHKDSFVVDGKLNWTDLVRRGRTISPN
tara:strand:+ start:2142 stop:2333 length:192 start_codon:yes stop_codon:yes gene_type:complete